MTDIPGGPRRVSNRVLPTNVTGYLMPWRNDQPVWLQVPGGGSDLYIPLFTNREKLVAEMARIAMPYDGIKKIDDSREFLDSIPTHAPGTNRKIHVIVDFHQVDGRVRYLELFRNREDLPDPQLTH
jgi:hypothetical protein